MRLSILALMPAAALALPFAPTAASGNSAPVVTNVGASQIVNTGQVRVTFDVSDADGDQVTARLICSSDNGVTFDLLPVKVSGDINRQMAPGPGKEIIWDAALDYPGRYWGQVVARVLVSDGPATSGEMVFVPAGSFLRGTNTGNVEEQPQRTIHLDAFYIDKFEVTNAEFQQFIAADGYSTQAFWSSEGWTWRTTVLGGSVNAPAWWGDDAYRSGPNWPGFPVIGVSWYEAEAYANFAGKRLPTEAEWEKAARGTDGRTYPWGEGIDESRANYRESLDPFEVGANARVTPVGFYDGRLHPNPPFQTTNSPSHYGLHDMAGNVWEWVADWYSPNYYESAPSTNPLGPVNGTRRVMRGGAWDSYPTLLRCAQRGNPAPIDRYIFIGFRCAKTGS